MAQSNGDILILRLGASDGRQIPEERRIQTECLPPRGIVFDLSKRACDVESLVFSPDGVALAVLDSQSTVSVFRVDDGYIRQSDGAKLTSVHLAGGAYRVAFGASGDELSVVTNSGTLLRLRLPLAATESQWPVLGGGHSVYRSPHGGDLRKELCGRLAGADVGIVRLADDELAEVSSAFPGLGLTDADQTPCEKRGLLATP